MFDAHPSLPKALTFCPRRPCVLHTSARSLAMRLAQSATDSVKRRVVKYRLFTRSNAELKQGGFDPSGPCVAPSVRREHVFELQSVRVREEDRVVSLAPVVLRVVGGSIEHIGLNPY